MSTHRRSTSISTTTPSPSASRTSCSRCMRDEAPVLLVRLAVRQGLLVRDPLRRHRGGAKDWRTFSSETGAHGARGSRARPDRGAQVDARHRPARALQPARDRQQGLHAAGGGGLRGAAARPDPRRSWTRRCPRASSTSSRRSPSSCRSRCCAGSWACRWRTTSADRAGRSHDRQHRPRPRRAPSRRAPRATEYRLLPFRSPYAIELFDYGHALAAERRAGAARRPRVQARHVGGRRRPAADRAGVRHHVPAAGGRRQRDHPPVDRPRHAGADGAPRGRWQRLRDRPGADEDRRSRRSCAGRRR